MSSSEVAHATVRGPVDVSLLRFIVQESCMSGVKMKRKKMLTLSIAILQPSTAQTQKNHLIYSNTAPYLRAIPLRGAVLCQ